MTKFTIELADTVTIAMRNGASVDVTTADLTGLGAELLMYGIGQKLRDAASAASTVAKETETDVQTVAQGMLNDALAALVAGTWSHRGEGGSSVDPRVAIARSIVRKAIKEKVGGKSPAWAKFTGLSDADQIAKLDETFAANEALFNPLVDEELARRAKAAKAKANAAKAVAFNI